MIRMMSLQVIIIIIIMIMMMSSGSSSNDNCVIAGRSGDAGGSPAGHHGLHDGRGECVTLYNVLLHYLYSVMCYMMSCYITYTVCSPWKVGIGAVACNTGCYRRRSPVTPGVTGAIRQSAPAPLACNTGCYRRRSPVRSGERRL